MPARALLAVRLIIVRRAKRAAIAGLERKMRVCTTGLHMVDPRGALGREAAAANDAAEAITSQTSRRSLRHSVEK